MRKNIRGTALITGGAKRIGSSIAKKLAKMGYDLIIHYNNSEENTRLLQEEIVKNFGVNCNLIKADLLDLKQVGQMIEELRANFKNWNLLINNASIFYKSNFLDFDFVEEIDKNFLIHLKVPILLSKALAENCSEQNARANIVNMLDKSIVLSNTQYFAYLLSKKSLAEFTKMLSLQLAPNIRVNAIAPGLILKSFSKKEEQDLIAKTPLKIKGSKKNINLAIKYLLDNEFLTGQILFVDGGASLN